MTKRLAIVNPEAGGGRCGKLASGAITALRAQAVDLEVWYTRSAGHAQKLAADAYKQGFREFVAVGGDGTSFEIINGLAPILGRDGCERPTLIPLPLGTGNSFVRDFDVEDADDMLGRIVAGKRQPCDVVRLVHDDGEVCFINILSFGYVADVCSMANGSLKGWGALGYAGAVVSKLPTLKPTRFKMRLDGASSWQQSGLLLSICNSQYTGGGMRMAPFADTGDGKVDLVLVGEISKPLFMKLFAKIFTGDHVHHPNITTAQAQNIVFEEAEFQDVMLDGEVQSLRPQSLQVLPGVIDVIV